MTIQSINTALPSSESPQVKVSGEKIKTEPVRKVGLPETGMAKSPKVELERIDLDKMVEEIKRLTERMAAELSFSVDRDLDRVVITVTDPVTKEVIRKIPPEELIELARMLREMGTGGDIKGLLVGLKG
jgi:flagellar protein FlaG